MATTIGQNATTAATNANNANGQTGTQNASGNLSQQQQVVMAQMFSAFLSRFMSVAEENSGN